MLQVFLTDPASPWHGAELVQETAQPPDKVYGHLGQLEASGWLRPQWKTAQPLTTAIDPARRRYLLAEDAAEAAERELATAGIAPKPRPRDGAASGSG